MTMETKRFLGLWALALLVLASGCSRVIQPKPMENMNLPIGGELPPAFWEATDEFETDSNIYYQKQSFWMLPFNLYLNEIRLSDNDKNRAFAHHVGWNDFGSSMLMVFLPYHFTYTDYIYERGTPGPIGKRGIRWTLLWTAPFAEGESGSDSLFQSKGIPLVHSWSRVRAKDRYDVRFWNTFWTFGPFALVFENETGDSKFHGYFASPLMLGGALGAILWSDYHISQDGEGYAVAHGPLFGSLGYMGMKSTVPSSEDPFAGPVASESTHTLLGGLLWHDYQRRSLEGQYEAGRYGPLWTAFGWQKRDGRFGLRVLFIPIKF